MNTRSDIWPARLGAALALLASATGWSQASEPLNAASYLRERGWTAESSPLPRSPNANLIPMQYYEKSAYAPSCGLLGRAANGKPQLLELAGPGEGGDWPQCMDIESMTAVRLGNRDYVAVVYLVRDTREDFYRYVEYVHADPVKGHVADTDLTSELKSGLRRPEADVVALGQAKWEARRFAPAQLQDDHFIATERSWFAVLEDRKAGQCRMLSRAGAAPVASGQQQCKKVLATTRLEKRGAMYYLAMFELAGGKRHVAIVSVTPDGHIAPGNALADIVNASAAKDIRAARAALARALP